MSRVFPDDANSTFITDDVDSGRPSKFNSMLTFPPRRTIESESEAAGTSNDVTMVAEPSQPAPVLDLNAIPDVPSPWLYRFTKRSLDILGALVGLTLFGPVMLVCSALIKLQDGGPILFSQTRVGERGDEFKIHKFRSMVVNADSMKQELMELNEHDDNRTFKILNDPRITPVGHVMRRLSLDELPQFWNILVGQMSLVGPRPALPDEVALYGAEDLVRLAVRPGLTCIWQVSGRSNLDFQRQMQMDAEYIRTRTTLLDLQLIAKTLPAVVQGDGAA